MTSTTTAKCQGCGRTLRAAKSLALGRGPRCLAKIRKAEKVVTLDDYKPRQIEQARELIEDGAIVPLRRRVFLTVSSDGTETYLTAPEACNCPAGLNNRRCYHRAAAIIVTAA